MATAAAEPIAPARAGGETTQDSSSRDAFSLPAANMPPERLHHFFLGNRLFNTTWTAAPGAQETFDGLGPTFNAEGCAACHDRDGRAAAPPAGMMERPGMLLRIALPDSGSGAPRPHPAYGLQIQDRAIPGVAAEARLAVRWEDSSGRYGDGTPYRLRRPHVSIIDPAFGSPGEGLRLSPRIANSVFGLGLLEAVPEETLAAMADPDDRDGDGIAGRVNRVPDPATGRTVAGRFGWKASQPSLRAQATSALRDDIGITSRELAAENCPAPQAACRAAPNGGAPEVPEAFLDLLTFYLESLAVPAARDTGDPAVERGRALFGAIGCASCHRPALRSGPHPNPLVANQRFAPYTDLLLHDMGDGLADGRPDHLATGRDWRTPPLWGLGLLRTVNGHADLLHDGRARGPAEAILWHGGEAERAKEAFRALPAPDRAALLRFLDSL